jgi:hypothetical protein
VSVERFEEEFARAWDQRSASATRRYKQQQEKAMRLDKFKEQVQQFLDERTVRADESKGVFEDDLYALFREWRPFPDDNKKRERREFHNAMRALGFELSPSHWWIGLTFKPEGAS